MSVTTPADRAHRQALAAESAELIEALQAPSGAYPASPTFSAYAGYSWFRDGAFIADAMSAAGRRESAERFFDWCAEVMTAQRSQIAVIVAAADAGEPVPDEAMLPTRFTLDGVPGTDAWWDFQLDGYGTWLWALGAHIERYAADPRRWAPSIELTVDYLVSSWTRPCFDWWEEHSERVHVSTLGSVRAGLRAAADLGMADSGTAQRARAAADDIDTLIAQRGVLDGHLTKWLGATGVDASLAALVGLMDVVAADSAVGRATIGSIERDLTVAGGVHRYLGDTYFGGGQWPLLSCFLGIAHARAGEPGRAEQLLDWAGATVRADGAMPEQVTAHLLSPDHLAEWIERWGPSACPLLWSHAMYIRLAVELGAMTSLGATT